MAKDSFLLLSLKEDQTKKLAQIVSSDTSRKILDFLANKKDATESQISKELNIPISTVHYNLQQLVKGKLIDIEEFHYSQKGKEVNHYKLANKFIIIVPKSTFGFKEKLRSILPVALLAIASTAIIQFFYKPFVSLEGGAMKAATFVQDVAMESAPQTEAATSAASEIAQQAVQQPWLSNIALWFLFGAILTIVFYFIFEYVRYLKEK